MVVGYSDFGKIMLAMNKMEKEFDSKMRIQNSASSSNNNNNNNSSTPQRSKSFAFRAPQENFSIQDFELGKIYGVGSYSKVQSFSFSRHDFRYIYLESRYFSKFNSILSFSSSLCGYFVL